MKTWFDLHFNFLDINDRIYLINTTNFSSVSYFFIENARFEQSKSKYV